MQIAVTPVIFVHTERPLAVSERLMLTLLLQNVVHLEADGGIPFSGSLADNCAFQISSLRFILLSVYPRRLW